MQRPSESDRVKEIEPFLRKKKTGAKKGDSEGSRFAVGGPKKELNQKSSGRACRELRGLLLDLPSSAERAALGMKKERKSQGARRVFGSRGNMIKDAQNPSKGRRPRKRLKGKATIGTRNAD